MTGAPCPYGCRSAKDPSKAQWHWRTKNDDCPTGRPKPGGWVPRPLPEAGTSPAAPGTPAPAPSAPPSAPSDGLTFSGRKAEVIGKGKSLVITPEEIDFIVGPERTLQAWNTGFQVVYLGHVEIDEWLEWKKHLPREQFKVSSLGEMTIRMQPRNYYARAVTFACKRFGCKNLNQANNFLDSVFFFTAFGGIGMGLIMHYRIVNKESPKLKRQRAEKAAKIEALKRQKAGAIDTTGRVLDEHKLEPELAAA